MERPTERPTEPPTPSSPPYPLGLCSGALSSFVRGSEADLLLSLMGSVKMADVSVETMCVINAAIVLFLIAEWRGDGRQLLECVWRAARRVARRGNLGHDWVRDARRRR